MATDEQNAKDALQALGVGPAAKELYVDLLRPAARETGQNLLVVAKLISVALGPLHGLVWGLEKVRDWLSTALLQRLAHVAPEDIRPPDTYVAGQVLLQLPFCADQKQLRELYANLLSAAMNKRRAASVHPAFVQVIQQLTPDEALILQAMNDKSIVLREVENSKGRGTGPSIAQQFRKFCEDAGVANIDEADAYLENLLRLRILSEKTWSKGTYSPAGVDDDYGEYEASLETSDGRLIEVGAFGDSFLFACLPPAR
jgi:hypothetical protein